MNAEVLLQPPMRDFVASIVKCFLGGLRIFANTVLLEFFGMTALTVC